MRAFGQGSLSSFLKAVLDVVVYALWALLALTTLALAVSLLAQPFIGAAPPSGRFAELARLLKRGPALFALLLAGDAYWAALLVVADRLRRVFATLIQGRPFRPENVRRLQVIGAALVVLEIAGYALSWLVGPGLGTTEPHGRAGGVNVSGWFSILVVFVLAEVFREGARLQAEAELTV